MATVRADVSRCADLVEESLRIDARVQGMFRAATRDADLAGVHVPAGAMPMLLYGSGNHDEAQFPGQGVHYCSGAPFARAEGRIGFEVLLERLTDIRLADRHPPFEWSPSFILRGMKELHLECTATPATTPTPDATPTPATPSALPAAPGDPT